jgi:hypothetical protein
MNEALAQVYKILGLLAPIMVIVGFVEMLPLGLEIPWSAPTLFLGAIAVKLVAKE